MAVTLPLPEDHFHGGRNLQQAGSRAGTSLVAIINGVDARAASGVGGLSTVAATGPVPDTVTNVVLDTSGGIVTVTLPSAAVSLGREIFITRVGASNGVVQRDGSDTIGAAATSITLAADGDGTTLVCVTATRWAIK